MAAIENATPPPQPHTGDPAQAIEAEPGVTQAIATYEAIEKVYFAAVAATPPAVVASSYATTTAPR